MSILPKIKYENLVEQNINAEILIYDLKINKAYCLNETAAIVYRHCVSVINFEHLRRRYNFTEDLILLTLDKLSKKDLVEIEMKRLKYTEKEEFKRDTSKGFDV